MNDLAVAQAGAALAFIVERHQPNVYNYKVQGYTCVACSALAGMPIPWPCPDREVIGDLVADPANQLLPGGTA